MQFKGVSLDDHRQWQNQIRTVTRTFALGGFTILFLVAAATTAIIVSATKSAMASNREIVEVLHFVGATDRFIAREFRRHFLLVGLKGAAAGGALAAVLFLVFSWWSARNLATPEADQAAALFGNFAIGYAGYGGVVLIVLLVSALTAATSQATVVAHLSDIDMRPPDS